MRFIDLSAEDKVRFTMRLLDMHPDDEDEFVSSGMFGRLADVADKAARMAIDDAARELLSRGYGTVARLPRTA